MGLRFLFRALTLLGDVYLERTSGNFLTVQLADCFFARCFVYHRYETEATRAATTRAGHNDGVFHLTGLREDFAKILASGIE